MGKSSVPEAWLNPVGLPKFSRGHLLIFNWTQKRGHLLIFNWTQKSGTPGRW